MLLFEKRLMKENRWVSYPHGISSEETHLSGGQPFINGNTARSLERKGLIDCLYDLDGSACELTQAGRYRAYDLEKVNA